MSVQFDLYVCVSSDYLLFLHFICVIFLTILSVTLCPGTPTASQPFIGSVTEPTTVKLTN